MTKPLLYFSTPAWGRYELSALCFAQRADAIERLAANGIEARCVVIADDANLEIAREYGFDVVERDNQWLGRRFNDGYAHALANGATHVFPVGSDSWVDPAFLYGMLDDQESVVASRHYAHVDQFGLNRQRLWIPINHGVSYVVPARMLAACGGRPCREKIGRGCDTATWQTLVKTVDPPVVFSEAHELETVAWRSDVGITQYEGLRRWAVEETAQPFAGLVAHYPRRLVDAMQRHYDRHRDYRLYLERQSKANGAQAIEIANRVLERNRVPSADRKLARQVALDAVRMVLEGE